MAGTALLGAQRLTVRTELRHVSPSEEDPWTGRCVQEKITADGKRHRCHRTVHHDIVHACKCSMEWKQF